MDAVKAAGARHLLLTAPGVVVYVLAVRMLRNSTVCHAGRPILLSAGNQREKQTLRFM